MKLDDLKLILVPTDFSEASGAVLEAAITLARTFHAAMEILHVDLDPTLILPPPADAVSMPNMMAKMAGQAAENLDRVVAEVRSRQITCTGATESGRTYAAIVAHAVRIGAGLIVMGSHGRHGLGHLLLGSVAEKVVQNASCPVLVVPVERRNASP
jgi:nucleotide-binding universal stress UspA family protein